MKRVIPAQEIWIANYPWLNPYTKDYPNNNILLDGLIKPQKKTILFACASHKAIAYYQAYNAKDLEFVDGLDWEPLNVWHEGEINGVYYYWGMPVLGMGLMEMMVPKEWSRELLPREREAWSKKGLVMVGSHSGKVSQTGLSTGISKEA